MYWMLGDVFNLFALATVSGSATRAACRSNPLALPGLFEWFGHAALLAPRVRESETEEDEEEAEEQYSVGPVALSWATSKW